MAVIGVIGGVLALLLRSCLRWVTYAPGGDSVSSALSGLQGGAWGMYTFAIAVTLIIASLLSASMIGRLRFALVAATALVGLGLA